MAKKKSRSTLWGAITLCFVDRAATRAAGLVSRELTDFLNGCHMTSGAYSDWLDVGLTCSTIAWSSRMFNLKAFPIWCNGNLYYLDFFKNMNVTFRICEHRKRKVKIGYQKFEKFIQRRAKNEWIYLIHLMTIGIENQMKQIYFRTQTNTRKKKQCIKPV